MAQENLDKLYIVPDQEYKKLKAFETKYVSDNSIAAESKSSAENKVDDLQNETNELDQEMVADPPPKPDVIQTPTPIIAVAMYTVLWAITNKP